MSYLAYWRLSRSPFSVSHRTNDFFVAGSIAEALARAEFLIQHERRLGILVGPQGVGKSSFFRHLAARRSRLPRQTLAHVDFSGATPILLAERIRDRLRGEQSQDGLRDGKRPSEPESLGRIIHEIDELLLATAAIGRQGVLLLDNAQDANEEVLETLGILLKRPGNWTAILAVDDALLVELPRRILETCELRIDLPAWDLGLTAEYFEWALARCGRRDDIFSAQGITRVHELSDGIPKRIFQLADMALVAGAGKRATSIDAELIDQVCDEFSISLVPGNWSGGGYRSVEEVGL
jgi:general secretion pathway protein A